MSISDDRLPVEENLIFDRETLANSINYILANDADAPDALARFCVELRQAVESGLDGINRARNTLAAAVEHVYLHTQAHDAALKLYRLSHEGRLKVEDEPVRLIGAAIERTVGEMRKS
ncbi:MAG TPA: hypothetical protein VJT82_02600 [Pyrinomonadaceae bacterium]|nr:hypothetical protein [Pyrinomonadaceae bacterium]